jgi:hypothetical protein
LELVYNHVGRCVYPISTWIDLIAIADLDGDSEMLSSSESASPVGARTPTFDKPATELSPPGSQTASHHESFTSSLNKLAADRAATSAAAAAAAADGKAPAKEAPGAAWNNQRSQEEYTRALENVVDNDFSLRECLSIRCQQARC